MSSGNEHQIRATCRQRPARPGVVYVCMYVCVCVCVRVCLCASVCLRACMCMRMCNMPREHPHVADTTHDDRAEEGVFLGNDLTTGSVHIGPSNACHRAAPETIPLWRLFLIRVIKLSLRGSLSLSGSRSRGGGGEVFGLWRVRFPPVLVRTGMWRLPVQPEALRLGERPGEKRESQRLLSSTAGVEQ